MLITLLWAPEGLLYSNTVYYCCTFPLPGNVYSLGFYNFDILILIPYIWNDYNPASYPMGTGAVSLRIKRSGREADRSPPSSAEVKNGRGIPQLLHTSSWRGA
jgi:hypothetical protein